MLKNLFFLLSLALLNVPGFSNDYYPSSENPSYAKNEISNFFVFTDFKSVYCGTGIHKVKFRTAAILPQDLEFTLSLLYPDGKISFLGSTGNYQHLGEKTVQFFFNENPAGYPDGKKLKFIISTKDKKYSSESPFFTFMGSFIKYTYGGHCKGYSTKLEYIGVSSYESIYWKLDGKQLPASNSSVLEATEPGNYSVVVRDKTCTAESDKQKVVLGIIPKVNLEYGVLSNLCDGAQVPILVEEYRPMKDVIYTEFHWELGGKVVEITKDRFFFAKEPGVYTVTAFQGPCSTKSTPLIIHNRPAIQNTIDFVVNNGVINTPALKTCKKQMVSLKLKIPRNLNWDDNYQPPQYYSDSILTAHTISFQWKKEGINIPGATNYYLETDKEGKFTLEIRQGHCVSNSNTLEIVHSEIVRINLTSSESVVCVNNTKNNTIAIRYKLPDPDFFKGSKATFFRDNTEIKNGFDGIADQSGSYSLRIKKNQECEIVSDTIHLTFTDKPIIFPTDTLYTCLDRITLVAKNENTLFTLWTFNGSTLSYNGNYLEAKESGFYTSRDESTGCRVTSSYLLIKNAAKVHLSINDALPACEGTSSTLKVYLPKQNRNMGFDLIRLYRNGQMINDTRLQATYIDKFFHTQEAYFPIWESGEFHVGLNYPNCEIITSPVTVNFKKINTALTVSSQETSNCITKLSVTQRAENGYQWYLNDKAVNSDNYELNIRIPGTYFAKIEEGNCVTFTDKFYVQPRDAPTIGKISGDTLVNAGASVRLKLDFTGTPPFSYILNNFEEGVALTSPHFHPLLINTHSVFNLTSVKNVCGEGTVSGEARIRVNVLANEPSVGKYIKIFPIPTSGNIEIAFDELDGSDSSYELFDSSGKTMIQNTKLIQNRQKLDLNHLPPGQYFIKVKAGKDIITRKIIKW